MEIFDVEEYRELEFYVRGQSPFESMHDLYMAEINRPRTIFLPLIVWVLHSVLPIELWKKQYSVR